MTYPGGKNGSGVYQAIINNIPKHKIYIETHYGGGSIMRLKKPANRSFAIDIDEVVCMGPFPDYVEMIHGDCIEWLKKYDFQGDEFIYVDPPYVMSSRKGGKIYNYEYDDQDHIELLTFLKTLPCRIAISGYASCLYEELLSDWRFITFQAMTRGGTPATEYLWMNYPEPSELHDYQYLGNTFTNRQRIKRKCKRWKNKFDNLPLYERQLILKTLQDS